MPPEFHAGEKDWSIDGELIPATSLTQLVIINQDWGVIKGDIIYKLREYDSLPFARSRA